MCLSTLKCHRENFCKLQFIEEICKITSHKNFYYTIWRKLAEVYVQDAMVYGWLTWLLTLWLQWQTAFSNTLKQHKLTNSQTHTHTHTHTHTNTHTHIQTHTHTWLQPPLHLVAQSRHLWVALYRSNYATGHRQCFIGASSQQVRVKDLILLYRAVSLGDIPLNSFWNNSLV